MNHKETISRGVIGFISPLLGAGVSLSNVEMWLRVGSLVIGIAVGIMTIISLLKNKKL